MPSSLSIVLVLEHYNADLSGVPDTDWHMIHCPFHSDQTASAGVNLELNGFRCHACGISGDAIKVIKDVEHLDFGGAVDFAREVLGASINEVSSTVPRSRKRRRMGSEKWKKILA